MKKGHCEVPFFYPAAGLLGSGSGFFSLNNFFLYFLFSFLFYFLFSSRSGSGRFFSISSEASGSSNSESQTSSNQSQFFHDQILCAEKFVNGMFK